MATEPEIELKNESQLEQEFNRVVLQRVLGYAVSRPGVPGTMEAKQGIPGGTIVDVALGHFAPNDVRITAPLELKGSESPARSYHARPG